RAPAQAQRQRLGRGGERQGDVVEGGGRAIPHRAAQRALLDFGGDLLLGRRIGEGGVGAIVVVGDELEQRRQPPPVEVRHRRRLGREQPPRPFGDGERARRRK